MVSESEDCSRHCQRNGLSPLQGNLSPRPYVQGEAKEVRVRATAHLTHQVPTDMCPGEWVTLYIIKRGRGREDERGWRGRGEGKGSEGEGEREGRGREKGGKGKGRKEKGEGFSLGLLFFKETLFTDCNMSCTVGDLA